MSSSWVSFEELQTSIGKQAALSFCRAFGGVSVYVPLKPCDRIEDVVGYEALYPLIRDFGGTNITTPNMRGTRQPKKSQIVSLLEQGASIRECALEVSCTDRYVRAIASQLRAMSDEYATVGMAS